MKGGKKFPNLTEEKIAKSKEDKDMAKKFELGMRWTKDWHDFEVTKIFKNGKIQITETWISEDSGKECKNVENYNVSEDEYGQFAWREKDKKYAFNENEEDGYCWWARTYAAGIEWGGVTEEEVIAELEEQGYEVKEATNIEEDTKMTDAMVNIITFKLDDVTYTQTRPNYYYKNENGKQKRISKPEWEQAWDAHIESGEEDWDMAREIEERKAEQEKADKQTENNFKKGSKRSKDVAIAVDGVTLTAKQMDFIKEASETSFFEHGIDSTLWCDVLVEEIGGQFAGNPFVVGAMISTLKEKGVVAVGYDKVNGRKCKFFGFTDAGKAILKEMGF